MKFSLLVFVTVDELLEMHALALEQHGGSAGLRDRGLLEAAAAMPQQTAFGQPAYPSMARMASALAFSLAKNHAFVDGNKRVAHMASFAFLEYNGLDVALPRGWAGVIEDVASGQCTREQLVKHFAATIVGGDAIVHADDDEWAGSS